VSAIHLLARIALITAVIVSPAFALAPPLSKAEAISIARQEVARRESWPHGAEYSAVPFKDGWRVTALRIEYPENRGSLRFVPDGFRTIVIDRTGRIIAYLGGKA